MTGINYYAGRIATIMGIVIGICTAIAPILAETDWTDTTAIIGGGLAAIVAVRQFIIGAQKHEDRIADPGNPINE